MACRPLVVPEHKEETTLRGSGARVPLAANWLRLRINYRQSIHECVSTSIVIIRLNHLPFYLEPSTLAGAISCFKEVVQRSSRWNQMETSGVHDDLRCDQVDSKCLRHDAIMVILGMACGGLFPSLAWSVATVERLVPHLQSFAFSTTPDYYLW
ncbi:hypothetical protein BDW62DRAFT_82710 [Aspergillus aurantiobrunneus]